ncbi:MAG: M2 family metallopeptidase [Candidatus Krumholzibacteria bacterium]|nr:M2 family metallopeptidase [Candidatus Krumholzibacteria bacterium]MDH4337408.1 M2 family metallopeptidase [Candidatus Krumholzibacteria bacterium]MDH5270901.1 M2 family metallopeptidase [Candidatus Krumholzibacteria bacterium]MDH5626701.1 M2 family metallopeptidase [Candidatus Krumholzibacteria bacterium]
MKRTLVAVLLVAASAMLASCGKKESPEQAAQAFVDSYTAQLQQLYYETSLAEWAVNTHIVDGDTTNAYRSRMAKETMAAFTGSTQNIEQARGFLAQKDALPDILVRQLNAILYEAANNPQTVPDLVKQRIKVETEMVEVLFGYDFKMDGKSISTNDIDELLRADTDLNQRLAAWSASKEVGTSLRPGLVDLQRYRNETVQALGYKDYFDYQVSEYGMTTPELRAEMLQTVRDIWPLYRELHTWARYELAKRYGVTEVPDMLPAHWLPNRWGQDWSSMVKVEGLDLDSKLKQKEPEWLVKQAESFYVSLGFSSLPTTFHERSDLYPAPEGADYKKNNHASAWHMDLDKDVRCLMSVIPNADWYETTHHELGHVYYYISYTNPGVPMLLRRGANRAYHEGVGSLMGLAAMQKPFIEGIGLFPDGAETDETQALLKEALNYIVFLPWSAGVMTEFEYSLYGENLPQSQFNDKWWELVKKYQGIVPPSPRGDAFCDAATKTHIIDDAAQYYDYAMSYVLLFQLHDHIASNILKQDPHATNYYGSTAVGDFLRQILTPGATRDWRELTREATGADVSAQPILRYFEPIMPYLKEQNQGRTYTLPETI